LPERFRRLLARAQAYYRVRAMLDAVMAGAAATGLAAAIEPSAAIYIGFVMFGAVAIAGWRAWSLRRAAETIERQQGCDNLLVTAEETLRGRQIHPLIAEELFAQATARLDRVQAIQPGALFRRAALAGAVVVAATLLLGRSDPARPADPESVLLTHIDGSGPGAAVVRAVVTPPAYTRRSPAVVDNPVQLPVLEGSRVQVEVNGVSQLDVVATVSRVLMLEVAGADRLLHLLVEPDRPPRVTIERPGRDLLFGEPRGSVPVSIAALDDFRVASLTLRYTRIAGSGETFSFEEGEVPIQIEDGADGASRRGSGTIALDQLKVEEGDTLVYRAFARDDKPGADPVVSDSFLIEIGKRGEASAGGFAVPEDRDRQGLSQQMLILKTERLHAQRDALAPDALLEQSRLLAVEQRMVRAEFLFMTGGEVVDEVEEAEHAHELASGRLENQGQVELLTAIREMSRAEARLNAADTAQALVFERTALAALQRAFDRRRYFLRTLPERARIDPSRRLSGDLSSARSSSRAAVTRPPDPTADALRQAIVELGATRQTRQGVNPQLAARILTLDPESPVLQEGAEAAAHARLASLLRAHLAAAATSRVTRDPLAGALGERLSRPGTSR
jgi:hypothetical protein